MRRRFCGMQTIMETLTEAAARGVEVTIITNDHPAPTLTLKWEFKAYRDSATGKFQGAGYKLYVIDCDGDGSEWSVERGGQIIAEGGTYDCDPYYHFDACLIAAEAALRSDVRKRLAALA